MQQIVAKRMDDFIPQGLRDCKRAAVDHRSGRRGGDGFHMADITTEPPEYFSTLFGCGGRGERFVSRWDHCAAYELSKVVDVSQAKLIGVIFRVLRDFKNCRGILRA